MSNQSFHFNKFKFWAIVAILLFPVTLLYQNCGLKRPKSGEQSSFSLEPFHASPDVTVMQCQTCHESQRKSPDHYAGQDCVGCHTPGNNGWMSTTGGHTATVVAAKNCATCHGTAGSHPSFPANHINTTGLDCSSCHQASINTGFVNWTGGVFEHNATLIAGKNCATCHEEDRPPTVTLKNINPSIAIIADNTHFAAKDCFACHGAPPTAITWRGASATQYEHTNASRGNINFCLTCHLLDEHVGRHGSVANDIVGDGKCQQCHTTRRSWDRQNRNPNL